MKKINNLGSRHNLSRMTVVERYHSCLILAVDLDLSPVLHFICMHPVIEVHSGSK